MDLLSEILDENEEILWQKEIRSENLIPDYEKYDIEKTKYFLWGILISIILIIITALLIVFINSVFSTFLIFGLMIIWFKLFLVRGDFKDVINRYDQMKQYRSDEELQDYRFIDFLTNKHFITFEPSRFAYPERYRNVDVSHIYEYRKEFCFFRLEKLTQIVTYVKSKKDRCQLYLIFDLVEHNITGYNAPHGWIKLSNQELEEALDVLSKFAPNAKIRE